MTTYPQRAEMPVLCSCREAPYPPSRAKEPECEHDYFRSPGNRNPASACVECRDGVELRQHREAWGRYWAAHQGPGHNARPSGIGSP